MRDTDHNSALLRTLDAYQAGLAVEGDREAFALLYRRWHPKLMRLALRLTRNQADAQDVMQEAAMTLARDIRKLKDPARFPAWACTIVRRRAADHIDRAVRQRRSDETAQIDQIQTDKADPDRALALKQALSQLPEKDRLMLKLFYLDGFRGVEIAAALNVPLGTVKSRLYAARQSLKTLYLEGDTHD